MEMPDEAGHHMPVSHFLIPPRDMVPNSIDIPFGVTNPFQTLTVSNSDVSIERSKIDLLRNYHRAVDIARTLLQLSSRMCPELASCKLIEFPQFQTPDGESSEPCSEGLGDS